MSKRCVYQKGAHSVLRFVTIILYAKGVANAIFPDATFFEAELSQTENLSKGEIQERIRRWSEYANINSLKSLYGNTYSDTALNEFLPTIRSFIENYTIKYETAPEEVAHTPCSWKMRKSLEYSVQLPLQIFAS